MVQAVSQSQSVGLRLTRLIVVDKKLGGVCPDAKVAKARAGSRVKKVVSARVGSLGNQDKLLQLRTTVSRGSRDAAVDDERRSKFGVV